MMFVTQWMGFKEDLELKTMLSSLGAMVLVTAVIFCLTAQFEAQAEGEGSNVGKAVDMSTQNSTAATAKPFDEKSLINSIGTLMDDKLAPLFQKQATLEKLLLEDKFSGPKMTDIVGGIGWILGLGGIAAFFWSFKRKRRK